MAARISGEGRVTVSLRRSICFIGRRSWKGLLEYYRNRLRARMREEGEGERGKGNGAKQETRSCRASRRSRRVEAPRVHESFDSAARLRRSGRTGSFRSRANIEL